VEGKVVLVTGGSRGIGRETARLFAKHGALLYICGRSRDALEKSAAELEKDGATVIPVQCDITDPEAARKMIEQISREAGRLDVLINNAGMSMRGSVEETSAEVISIMAAINYLGPAYVTHYALPLLKNSRGSIVFVSSITALYGLPFVGAYGAGKMAFRGFAQSLRAEVFRSGVHVGIVNVGLTENDPEKQMYGSDGSLLPLPRRRNSHSQQKVAACIYRCTVRRKREMTLTFTGNAAAFLFRYFPPLTDFILTRFSGKGTSL
jgi:short-subunit dehydrogenase